MAAFATIVEYRYIVSPKSCPPIFGRMAATLSFGTGRAAVVEPATCFGAKDGMTDDWLGVKGISLALVRGGVETLDTDETEGVGGMRANEGGVRVSGGDGAAAGWKYGAAGLRIGLAVAAS
jgi:hypothetical protein